MDNDFVPFAARKGTKASDSIAVPPERRYPLVNAWEVVARNPSGVEERVPIPAGKLRRAMGQLPKLTKAGFRDIHITNAA